MVILETPRLVLRHLVPTDLDALFALYRDPEMRRYYPDGTRTRAETEEELHWHREGRPEFPGLGLWATVERCSGAFLGRCGLLPQQVDGRPEVELAYMIDKTRWREGFATEAARAITDHARTALHLSRLICFVTPGNDASAGVAKKVGMVFEREYRDELGLCHIYARRLDAADRS
jgi:[ribosomal protein S5]-alanine N-acetyltransferase